MINKIAWLVMALLLGGCAAFFEGDEGVRPLPIWVKPIQLEELAIDFHHRVDRDKTYHLVGSAAIDVDGDGRFEIFVGGGLGQEDALFGYEAGKMINKIAGTGLSSLDATYGATAIDLDNDGDVDLIVVRNSCITIYYAERGGRFKPYTLPLRLPRHSVALNATPIDIEGDGDIDLYISVFIDREHFRSVTYNDPTHLRYNQMLRNDGSGRWTDITDSITRGLQNSFTALAADLDRDGLQDLVLAQNTGEVEILRNRGKGKFSKVPLQTGYGFWMGVAAGDIDNDGDIDMLFSNAGSSMPAWILQGDLTDEMKFNGSWLVLRNEGDFRFTDISQAAGLGSLGFGWGVVFEDINYDGVLDMLGAQNYINWPFHHLYKLNGKIMLNDPRAPPSFYGVEESVGSDPYFGHTPLLVDIDGDGKKDVIWINADGPIKAYRNRTSGNYVAVELADDVLSLGAVIEIQVGDRRYRRQMTSSQGLTTDQPPIMVFGLGEARQIAWLRVIWSDGKTTRIRAPAINRVLRVRYSR